MCFPGRLFFRDVADTVLAQEKPGPMSGEPETEAILVVIADMALQALAVLQHDRNLGMRIDQGLEKSRFGARLLGMDEIFRALMRLPRLANLLHLTMRSMRRMGSTLRVLRMLPLTEPVLIIFPEMVTPGKCHILIPVLVPSGDGPFGTGDPFAPGARVQPAHSEARMGEGKKVMCCSDP